MSHLEKILDKVFGKDKSELLPPRAPAKVEKRHGVELDSPYSNVQRPAGNPQSDSKTLAIDFNNLDPRYKKWCLSLETQRHYYYTKFGKVHRKNRIEVKKDLEIKNQELDMVELMKKKKVGLYKDCMKELKEVLKNRERR